VLLTRGNLNLFRNGSARHQYRQRHARAGRFAALLSISPLKEDSRITSATATSAVDKAGGAVTITLQDNAALSFGPGKNLTCTTSTPTSPAR
jgi:hypothetical protein